MSSHRVYLEGPLPGPGERLTVGGTEALHALRVKRVGEGDIVELLDGRGTVARARVERGWHRSPRGADSDGTGREPQLTLIIESVTVEPPVSPRVEVWSATPKGGGVDELIDGLSQVGGAAWTPMRTVRSIVSPRPAKLDRLRRIAVEAAKQAGRAWVLEVGPERGLDEALAGSGSQGPRQHNIAARGDVVLADASGAPYAPTGAASFRILIGPEGGWTASEIAAAREAGARVARFGPHTMRIETAAVAAAAIVLAAERRG